MQVVKRKKTFLCRCCDSISDNDFANVEQSILKEKRNVDKLAEIESGITFARITFQIFLNYLKHLIMPIVKVIEVIASSEKSFDDAIQSAVTEVSKTVKNIDSVYVKDFKVHVKDEKVHSYGVICKVSFRVNESAPNASATK